MDKLYLPHRFIRCTVKEFAEVLTAGDRVWYRMSPNEPLKTGFVGTNHKQGAKFEGLAIMNVTGEFVPVYRLNLQESEVYLDPDRLPHKKLEKYSARYRRGEFYDPQEVAKGNLRLLGGGK